jgi:hypothetical protein
VIVIQGDDVRGMDLTLERVESNDCRGKILWIQENTERDYSQRKYGKNTLVVGNGDYGDDGENPRRCRFKVEETTNRKGRSTYIPVGSRYERDQRHNCINTLKGIIVPS